MHSRPLLKPGNGFPLTLFSLLSPIVFILCSPLPQPVCTYWDNRLLCGLGWSETVYLFILDMVSLCISGQHWVQIPAYICPLNAGIKDGHHHAWLQFSSYIVQAGLNPWFSSLSTGIMGMGHNAKLLLTHNYQRPLPWPIRWSRICSKPATLSLSHCSQPHGPFCRSVNAGMHLPLGTFLCTTVSPIFFAWLLLGNSSSWGGIFDFLLSAALLVLLIPFDSLHYFYSTC